MDRLKETCPDETETKAQFLARLKKCAKSLPKGVVSEAIGKMKDNLQALVDAKGNHPKRD